MSSIETKVKKILLYEEPKILDDYSMFGWRLVGREVADNATITELRSATLTFERDSAMANYDKITELERIYNSISEPALITCRPSVLLVLGCLLSLILGVCLFVFATDIDSKFLMLVGLMMSFFGEVVTPFVLCRYARLKNNFNLEFFKYSICVDVFREKEAEISEKVRALM